MTLIDDHVSALGHHIVDAVPSHEALQRCYVEPSSEVAPASPQSTDRTLRDTEKQG